MLDRSKRWGQWRRTRPSILAMGGILLGATVSGISRVSAGEREHGHDEHEHEEHEHEEHEREHDRDHDFDFGFDHDHGHDGGHGPACYLRGTHILTPLGEWKIEDLRKGDLVITAGGQAKLIEWIGGRRYNRAPGQSWGAAISPVLVARGALGPDLPHADLFLSQEHCLSFDGGLIRVGDLLNGTSICLDPRSEFTEIEYLHIKLGAHDVIYAEGAAVETLLLNPISVERPLGIRASLCRRTPLRSVLFKRGAWTSRTAAVPPAQRVVAVARPTQSVRQDSRSFVGPRRCDCRLRQLKIRSDWPVG